MSRASAGAPVDPALAAARAILVAADAQRAAGATTDAAACAPAITTTAVPPGDRRRTRVLEAEVSGPTRKHELSEKAETTTRAARRAVRHVLELRHRAGRAMAILLRFLFPCLVV